MPLGKGGYQRVATDCGARSGAWAHVTSHGSKAWGLSNRAFTRRNLLCESVVTDFTGLLGVNALAGVAIGRATSAVTSSAHRDGAFLRSFTLSAIVLLIPAIGTTVLLTHPGLPLWPYLVCAALTGLGGGNFVVNEQRQCFLSTSAQGFGARNCRWAGAPATQLVGLLAIATVGERKPYLVCAPYGSGGNRGIEAGRVQRTMSNSTR